jgi:hypothetical protein
VGSADKEETRWPHTRLRFRMVGKTLKRLVFCSHFSVDSGWIRKVAAQSGLVNCWVKWRQILVRTKHVITRGNRYLSCENQLRKLPYLLHKYKSRLLFRCKNYRIPRRNGENTVYTSRNTCSTGIVWEPQELSPLWRELALRENSWELTGRRSLPRKFGFNVAPVIPDITAELWTI